MSVFISWSKPRSQAFAVAMHKFIKRCIQAANPWMSMQTPAGAAWAETIMAQLESAVAGIICLTQDNQQEPWLIFEGGALAKQRILHVVSVDIAPSAIKFPFAAYQATVPTKEGMLELLRAINKRLDALLQRADADLVEDCDLHFPAFDAELQRVRAMPQSAETKKRTEVDMLEELVTTTRQIASVLSEEVIRERIVMSPEKLRDVIRALKDMNTQTSEGGKGSFSDRWLTTSVFKLKPE